MKSTLSLKHNDKLMNLKHNNRSFDEKEWGQTTNKHIDRSLSQYNTTFIKEDIKQAYEKAFGEALKEYNEKQNKKSRRIDDYYEYIKEKVDKAKGKKKGNTTYNLQDEVILTIGNKEMWDNIHQSFHDHYKDHEKAEEAFIQYKKQKSDAIFKEFLEEFQAKHKHLYVFNAVAHYDEKGAPHLHMNFFGMAEGVEKGLRLQPRTTRAIAQDLDGDFYEKMQATSKAKSEFEKENRRRKKAGLEPLQADRKAFMSASADVYTHFLSESKQIFIDKARAHGFEYVPGETNPIKDLHTFKKLAQKAEQEAKEKAEKLLAKANKEINEYKEAKLSDIDKEAGNKQAKIKELDKDLAEKKSKVEALENATEMAAKAKDEASREERIARQNAENAQKQAEKFQADLERVKVENEAKLQEQKQELAEISEKIADQTLELEETKRQATEQAQALTKFNEELENKVNEKEVELELLDGELAEKQAEAQGAGESAQRARQEAQQAQQAKEQAEREAQNLRADIERLRAEKQTKESTIAAIDETMGRKQAILDDVNQRFDERRYDFEKRQVMKRYNELTDISNYSDKDVRPNTFNSDELIIKKKHYENLKQKASFFDRAWELKDSLREIKDTLMEKINESFIVQSLKKTIKDLRKKVASLTKENESLKKEKEEHEIYLTFSQQQQVRYWIQQGKKNHEEALERMQREDERDFHHQPQRNQQRDRDEEERTIIDDWEER